jgi:hypothetical protein
MKLFIQKTNVRFNIEIKCKVCGVRIINENKIINFIDKNKNEYNSNYIICENCLNNTIKYISSNLLENFISTSIDSFNNSMIRYNTELNKFDVEWENIKYNDKNIEDIPFLYGFMKHDYKFTVKFKIKSPSPPPKYFKLEKQGGIGSISIENEKLEEEFTKEFTIYDLDHLYPGTYEKYIYLKDRNINSNRKYYKINIYSNIDMKKK